MVAPPEPEEPDPRVPGMPEMPDVPGMPEMPEFGGEIPRHDGNEPQPQPRPSSPDELEEPPQISPFISDLIAAVVIIVAPVGALTPTAGWEIARLSESPL